MKTTRLIFSALLIIAITNIESCGPVIVSGGYNYHTPPWFYPNRVVNLRYVYFPDYTVYYDLSLGNYIYFDNGIWLTARVLPPRFNGINFKHAKQIRVNNYYGDNIKEYHRNNNTYNKGRRSSDNEEPTTIRRRN